MSDKETSTHERDTKHTVNRTSSPTRYRTFFRSSSKRDGLGNKLPESPSKEQLINTNFTSLSKRDGLGNKLPVSPSKERSSNTSLRSSDSLENKLPESPSKNQSKLLTPHQDNGIKCKIEKHMIERNQPYRSSSLNTIRRTLPDRAAYCVVFIIEVHDREEINTIGRKYAHFKLLHRRLRRKFPRSSIPYQLPACKLKRYDDEYISTRKMLLTEYLSQLCGAPEVVKSDMFRKFLEDYPQSEGSDDEEELVVSNELLLTLPEQKVVIKRGESFLLTIDVPEERSIISWYFTTSKYDIAFSIKCGDIYVWPYSRESSHHKPVKGNYVCPLAGVYTLVWDNSYSWRRPKRLAYRAQVLKPDALTLIESDFVRQKNGKDTQDGHSLSPSLIGDGGKVGYLTSNKRFSTRQLVNSTISLFRWPNDSMLNNPGLKIGYLIIHLGRHLRTAKTWYRKWFALDVERGILCCYNREHVSRKNVVQAKLSLKKKNSSISVVGNQTNTPTPYYITLISGMKQWEVCAESESDFNEWREALSTSIYLAHWLNINESYPSEVALDNKEIHSNELKDELEQGDEEGRGEKESFEDDDIEEEDDEDDEDFPEEFDNNSDISKIHTEISSNIRSVTRYVKSSECPRPIIEIPTFRGTLFSKLAWMLIFNIVLLILRCANVYMSGLIILSINIPALYGICKCWRYNPKFSISSNEDTFTHPIESKKDI